MTRPGEYMLSDFPGARAPNATGCLLGTWQDIGEESFGLEWIYGCLYVHFESILGFTRNKQMGCSEAFRCYTNGVKHPRNITSHVGLPRNVSGENMTKSREVKNVPKTAKIEGYIIHAFGLSQGRAPNTTGYLLGTWEVIGKESCGLERICGCIYDHFETILGFTRNEQIGCSNAFRGNTNCTKHPHNITNHIGTPRNVSGEHMTRLGKVQNVPKTTKIEGYNTRFRSFSGPELWTRRDASYVHGRWLERVMWLGTKMWMPLRSFRCSFRFREKWTNGDLEAFRGNKNGAKHPRNFISHVGVPRNVSREKIWPGPEKSKNIPKTTEIEGYNTHFRSFPGPTLRTPRDAT